MSPQGPGICQGPLIPPQCSRGTAFRASEQAKPGIRVRNFFKMHVDFRFCAKRIRFCGENLENTLCGTLSFPGGPPWGNLGLESGEMLWNIEVGLGAPLTRPSVAGERDSLAFEQGEPGIRTRQLSKMLEPLA